MLVMSYILHQSTVARHNVASVLREDALVKQKQAKERRDSEAAAP